MDVEKIQRVNNLALDLINQGLASNRDDALSQAENILQGSDGTREYAAIRDQIENKIEKTKEVAIEKDNSLSQDEIKNILTQNSNFLVKKIKEFQAKVETMEQEMNKLKLIIQSTPTIKEIVSKVPDPEPTKNQQTNENTPHPVQKKPIEESHPRSGNYTDVDVSIEKYFYMGRK